MSTQHYLYLIALVFVGLQNGFDILGWIFEGYPGLANLWLNRLGNVFLFMGNPVPVTLWFLYSLSLNSAESKRFRLWRNLALQAVVDILRIKSCTTSRKAAIWHWPEIYRTPS